MLLAVAVLTAVCFLVRRDDSTSAVRQIIAHHLRLDSQKVKAASTMGELGYTKQRFQDLIRIIEKHFSTTLSSTVDPRIGCQDESWKEIRVGDLADLVRPEWSRRAKSKFNQ